MAAATLLLVLPVPGAATPIILVYPSPAPNTAGASWNGYVNNAVSALENGQATQGDPNDPTFYQQSGAATQASNIATGFPSWHGNADPGTAFGSNFANELGNQLTFGAVILGNGFWFSLSDLSYVIASSDPGNILGAAGSFAGANYGSGAVGFDYGADGVAGGGDDVWVTTGPATQMVNELYLVGAGTALTPGPSCPGNSQATLDCLMQQYLSVMPFQVTATYSLNYTDTKHNYTMAGSGMADFSAPEPGTWVLFATGLAGILIGSRRFRRR
jgi:hypothetical protein